MTWCNSSLFCTRQYTNRNRQCTRRCNRKALQMLGLLTYHPLHIKYLQYDNALLTYNTSGKYFK